MLFLTPPPHSVPDLLGVSGGCSPANGPHQELLRPIGARQSIKIQFGAASNASDVLPS